MYSESLFSRSCLRALLDSSRGGSQPSTGANTTWFWGTKGGKVQLPGVRDDRHVLHSVALPTQRMSWSLITALLKGFLKALYYVLNIF